MKNITRKERNKNMFFFYEFEVIAPWTGGCIWIKTSSNHFKGECRWISTQHGVEVTSCLKRKGMINNLFNTSDGSGTQNGFWKCRGKAGLRQVEKEFSSIFFNFCHFFLHIWWFSGIRERRATPCSKCLKNRLSADCE